MGDDLAPDFPYVGRLSLQRIELRWRGIHKQIPEAQIPIAGRRKRIREPCYAENKMLEEDSLQVPEKPGSSSVNQCDGLRLINTQIPEQAPGKMQILDFSRQQPERLLYALRNAIRDLYVRQNHIPFRLAIFLFATPRNATKDFALPLSSILMS
jgi:hypothetical protein